MDRPESDFDQRVAGRLWVLSVAATDHNLIAKFTAGLCTDEEAARVREMAATDPSVAFAAGLDPEDPLTLLPPPPRRPAGPPPPGGGRLVFELLLASLLLIAPGGVFGSVLRQPVADTLSSLDARALVEERVWTWGLFLSVATAVLAVVLGVFVFRGWRRALPGVVVVAFTTFAAVAFRAAVLEHETTRADLDAMLMNKQWVGYESPKLDPYLGEAPTEADVEVELTALHERGGFDGLITFSSDGPALARVPLIAKTRCKFKAVVAGIYVPEGKDGVVDLKAADDAVERQLRLLTDPTGPGGAPIEHVDALVVGHNLSNRIPLGDLVRWVAEVRRRTKKPTTTTAQPHFYTGPSNRAFRQIGDFYCPDCVSPWSIGVTPQQAVADLRQNLLLVGELTDKPVLIKMISFPSAGRGWTEESQLEYFRAVSSFIRPPRGVYLSVFSAFDLPWKRKPTGWDRILREWALGIPSRFDETEAHTGLFTTDLKPKAAVEVLRLNGFLVQNRP